MAVVIYFDAQELVSELQNIAENTDALQVNDEERLLTYLIDTFDMEDRRNNHGTS